jgi:hypothetical protein
MSDYYASAAEFEAFCRARRWRFCFIGGLAVLRWGLPRMTLDVDISLLTGYENTPAYIDELLRHFPARMTDAAAFARAHRVLLVTSHDGTPADISLAAVPFEEDVIARAGAWQATPDVALTTCSAEDLIVYKAFANRARDWDDIEGILQRQGPALNLPQIMRALQPLCDARDTPGVIAQLDALVRRTTGAG